MGDSPDLVNIKFYACLGMFHTAWCTIDLTISYGIGQFLNIPDEEVHVLTAGWEFGRKSTIFRNLLARKGHKNRAKITGALNKIQNESARNAITHGLHLRGEKHVCFMDRSKGGDYRAVPFIFTYDEFGEHVQEFVNAGEELEKALGMTDDIYNGLAAAAMSADSRASKSPTPPNSKAPEFKPYQSLKAVSKAAKRSSRGKGESS